MIRAENSRGNPKDEVKPVTVTSDEDLERENEQHNDEVTPDHTVSTNPDDQEELTWTKPHEIEKLQEKKKEIDEQREKQKSAYLSRESPHLLSRIPLHNPIPSMMGQDPRIGMSSGDPIAWPQGPNGLPPQYAGCAGPPPPPPPRAQTLLYTVGFGIDTKQHTNNGWDATEAASRALQDAMERSTVRLPPSGHRSPFQIHVKIGVPARQDIPTRMEPMNVDRGRLISILPRSIPILPIDVVVGGLSMSGHDDPDVNICAAVACVTVQSNQERHAWERVAATTAAMHPQRHPLMHTMTQIPHMEQSEPWSTVDRKPSQEQTKHQISFNRVDSMEMLARISEQVRERPNILGGRLHPSDIKIDATTSRTGYCDEQGAGEDERFSNAEQEESYKKLPPGVTAKNNKRQFVQHNYHDHSLDLPTPMEETPISSSTSKGSKVSAPSFPGKLHELLNEINTDSYGCIISWIPHGRSFKIHEQQEFLDIVLPQYFVMTKKSSFLRQLNLYGFHRLSAGPDKGSYYHELFLRGMPWLCRRMSRQKVNGNGIRAAGNPDMEPDFHLMPTVPREELSTARLRDIYVRNHPSDEQPDAPSPPPSTQKDNFDAVTKVANGPTQISFPLKLQTMLDKLEAEENAEVMSWLPHGMAFLVHKPDIFVNNLMPAFFRQTKYSSFQRQLHMYSFQRITAGQDKGAYYHELFLRGKPMMCAKMVRTRINGKGCRKPGNPSNEPDFYSMKPMTPIRAGANIEIPKEMVSPGFDDDGDDGISSS